MEQFFKIQDLGAIAPELELIIWGMVLLLADLVVKDKKKLGILALLGIAFSGGFLYKARAFQLSAYGGVLAVDEFSNFFRLIFLVAAALFIALSLKYLEIVRGKH